MRVGLCVGCGALAIALMVTPARAQERLVHQETDRNTNAVLRVFKTMDGGRIEVVTPKLRVTKSVAGRRVTTRMTEGGDSLVIAQDDGMVSVSSSAGRVSALRTDRAKLERARVLMADSVVGKHAATLIGRLGFGAGTPVQPMLLTTRAFILAAANESGSREISRWAREARERLRSRAAVTKVVWPMTEQDGSSKSMTPTECWDAYSKEAIAAYTEYEECMKDKAWWDVLGQMGCATVYDMRAIGAFTWWMKCVAIN